MNLLTSVDGDEVSPVRRAANRRNIILKGDNDVDNELGDIMAVPWEREGALLDEIRKDGINDETVEKAFIAAVRLLKGVEGEFSSELIEKLGTELYGKKNPKLNSTSVRGAGELTGSDSGEGDQYGSASGAPKDGSGRDGELIGSGSAPKVAANSDNWDGDDNEPDDDADDSNKKKKKRTKAAKALMQKALGVTKAEDDSADIDDVSVNNDEGGTVEIPVPVRKEDGTWDFSGVPSESRPFFEEIVQKADKTEKELQETREKLEKADGELRHRSMVEKAAAYSHVAPTDELAPILKAASEGLDSETFEKLETLLGAAEERITKGDLFSEMGKKATGESQKTDDAYSEIVKKAQELVEKGGDLSEDQAIARVMAENPALYAQYMAEFGMGVS